jgi:hypothetical protein
LEDFKVSTLLVSAEAEEVPFINVVSLGCRERTFDAADFDGEEDADFFDLFPRW